MLDLVSSLVLGPAVLHVELLRSSLVLLKLSIPFGPLGVECLAHFTTSRSALLLLFLTSTGKLIRDVSHLLLEEHLGGPSLNCVHDSS